MNNDISATPTATPSTTPQPPRQGGDGLLVQSSIVQLSIEKLSTTQSLEKEVIKDPFIEEMEEYEANEGRDDKKRFLRI